MTYIKNSAAFTLVELAIVIVIIGLLVGGVLQGQELMDQARQRQVRAEFNGFMAATATFIAKYNGLPGDIRGFRFFGNTTDCLNITNIAHSKNNGCNGDSNGVYSQWDSEGLLYWKHLARANMIKGDFTGSVSGTHGSTDCCLKAGENIPVSTYNNASYWLRATDESLPARVNNINRFHYGKIRTNGANRWLYNPVLTQQEAYEFDVKFDDGLANSGAIMAEDGFPTTSCMASGDYNKTATSGGCLFYFMWNIGK
jgi:type II secretory pathway pseudopilin PulG